MNNQPLPTAWRVIGNGKDTGIVETNAAFAFTYWSQRHIQTGVIYHLVPSLTLKPIRESGLCGESVPGATRF